MEFTYEIETADGNYKTFTYEPTVEKLKKALAICIIKNTHVKPVNDYVQLVINIIDNHDLLYDDNILEYYEDNLKDELEEKAFEYFNETQGDI